MSVIENCVVFGIWLHIKLRKVKDDDKFVKHQQYIENIVHEILIYPVLITTVVGFVNDRMYNVGDFLEDPLFWAQFVLLIGGMLELIWTQVIKQHNTHRKSYENHSEKMLSSIHAMICEGLHTNDCKSCFLLIKTTNK